MNWLRKQLAYIDPVGRAFLIGTITGGAVVLASVMATHRFH